MQIREKLTVYDAICDKCQGYGKIVKQACAACAGTGTRAENAAEHILIPKGVSDGQILRKEGRGDVGENRGKNGDLFIQVKVRLDSKFKRDGQNIYSE